MTWCAAAAAALLVLAAQPAAAQFVCTTTPGDSTCVNNDTTAAAGVNVAAGANQNATTTNNGTTPGFNAVTLGGGNATAINNGTSTTGFIAETTAGGNAVAINNGINGGFFDAVTTNGGSATAINAGVNASGFTATTQTGDATGINSGTNNGPLTVETQHSGNTTAINTGFNASDVSSNALTLGSATTINSGTVGGIIDTTAIVGNATTTNSGSVAGQVLTSTSTGNATLSNSGTILGPVTTQVFTGSATFINTGAVIDAVVVAATVGAANVANTGLIQGQLNVHASTMATLTNAGTISNFGGPAVVFSGGADTLNLMRGSTIVGAIDLIGTNDTINFISGNHNLTFNTLAGATVGGNEPFVVSGNRAVAIDPTPFGLADVSLMDFTRAVSGMLDGIGGGAAPSGPMSSAFAAVETPAGRIDQVFATIPGLGYADDQAPVFKAPTYVTRDGRAIWARGFGGERTQDAQDGLAGAHTQFFGGAVGFDMVARRDLRLGLFAGGGESRLTLDGNQGATNSDMAFGGLYGRWSFVSPLGRDSFLDFALHGGGGSNTTSRTVNNNTIPGGIEIATARYNSSYITPELKYGVNIPLWARYTLTPSVGVRYVAGFFGGYTEAGTTAPLTVANRTIQDFEERGEVKLTHATPIGPDLLLTSVHVGAIGLERAGDTTVDATVLGINLPFVTPGRSTVGGLVGGGGFEWRTREGVSFFGAGEAISFSDASTLWSAKGGVRVAF